MLVGSKRRVAGRRGQATTEWALLLSILVIALFAIGWILGGGFATDMAAAADRAKNVYTTGTLNR